MSSWWNITGFFSQRWEILTGSVPATINGSDTCVCFIKHMQSPGHDPNIHYLGFLRLFFPFFLSWWDHYLRSFTSSVQQNQRVFQPHGFYTSLIRSMRGSCWEKQILKGMKGEQGSSRLRDTSKSQDTLDLQIGTAVIFESMFGFFSFSPPNLVNYMCRALFLK